ncbi:MAG: HU family DNA-binding protein [Parabacteroides sp.]|jgi:nucleoid DNA-binding protein|nr:HU family DNA-binding protein [Parabacteroides sp.]MBP8758548.1 HU family DNA-binding protein [Parabacteroides sp.]MBP9480179.1 HU family DNA-binding protein [Parabacteroides sp.]MBP9578478.1 HU family DNA-binding protein [Parabacteroides sp.]MDD2415273.1 HU family DNA-binding protein [Parabacteroides sp.]
MNNRLTIQEIATLLSVSTGKSTQDAEKFLREFVAVVSVGVLSDRVVKIKGLGTLKILLVEDRESIHVNTGERILIPAHYKYSFIPDTELKELVNRPFSIFETTEINDSESFPDLEVSLEDEPESESESDDEALVVSVGPSKENKPEIQRAAETSLDLLKEILEETPTDNNPVVEEEVTGNPLTDVLDNDAHVDNEPEELNSVLPSNESVDIAKVISSYYGYESENQVSSSNTHMTSVKYNHYAAAPAKKKRRKRSFGKSLLYLLIIGALGLFFLGLFFYFQSKEVKNILPIMVESVPQLEEIQIATPDSIAKDSVQIKSSPETLPITPSTPSTASLYLDTIVIKSGDRLTLVSQKYYGHKLFWVYLYLENKDAIGNPNHVPIGTSILIPIPQKYNIDANQKVSLDKAAALQTQILNEE